MSLRGSSLLASEDRELLRGIEALEKPSIVATYTEIMGSRQIYRLATEALNMSSSERGDYAVKAVVLPSTSALELTVQGPNPELVRQLNNKVGEFSVEQIREFHQIYDIHLLDPATLPKKPYAPTPERDAGISVILGLLIGGGLAILRANLPNLFKLLGKSQPEKKSVLVTNTLANTQRTFLKRVDKELSQSQPETISLGVIQFEGLQNSTQPLRPATVEQLLSQIRNILQKEMQAFEKTAIIEDWTNNSFVILLPTTSSRTAVQIFEHVQKTLSAPMVSYYDDQTVLLDPYAGITTYQGNQTAVIFLDQAEIALEWAHHNGNKTIHFSS